MFAFWDKCFKTWYTDLLLMISALLFTVSIEIFLYMFFLLYLIIIIASIIWPTHSLLNVYTYFHINLVKNKSVAFSPKTFHCYSHPSQLTNIEETNVIKNATLNDWICADCMSFTYSLPFRASMMLWSWEEFWYATRPPRLAQRSAPLHSA